MYLKLSCFQFESAQLSRDQQEIMTEVFGRSPGYAGRRGEKKLRERAVWPPKYCALTLLLKCKLKPCPYSFCFLGAQKQQWGICLHAIKTNTGVPVFLPSLKSGLVRQCPLFYATSSCWPQRTHSSSLYSQGRKQVGIRRVILRAHVLFYLEMTDQGWDRASDTPQIIKKSTHLTLDMSVLNVFASWTPFVVIVRHMSHLTPMQTSKRGQMTHILQVPTSLLWL